MNADLIEALAPAMHAAGRLVETIRERGVTVIAKADRSPVTEADHQCEALLVGELARIDPGALVIGEEACAAGGVPTATERFWLIDPVDGTRSFVDGGSDYSVNLGLIEHGVAVLGLLLAPRTGVLWAGVAGSGAWREDAHGRHAIASRALAQPPVVLTSHLHRDRRTDDWLTAIGAHSARPSSSSLKFCLLAEGQADCYPRLTPTSEWDTAAGHAILSAAGGTVIDESGGPLGYGKPQCRNGGFLAVGDPAALGRLPPLAA